MKKHKDNKPKVTLISNRSREVNGWEDIYKKSLMIKEGSLPLIVVKYIQCKIHATYNSILKESFKLKLDFEDFVEHVLTSFTF